MASRSLAARLDSLYRATLLGLPGDSFAQVSHHPWPIEKRPFQTLLDLSAEQLPFRFKATLFFGPVSQRLSDYLAGRGVLPRFHRGTKTCCHLFGHGDCDALKSAHDHTLSHEVGVGNQSTSNSSASCSVIVPPSCSTSMMV